MIESALYLTAAAVIGALIHRYRGGGFPVLPSPGRSLWLAAPAVGLIAWPFVGALPAFYLFVLYLAGSVQGWGSYFDLGRKADGWKDDPEVGWIDTSLAYLFGEERAGRSPGWRFKRDFTGMALRGLHYLPMVLVIPSAFVSWWALVPGVIAVALFAPAYWLGYQVPRSWGREFYGTSLAEYVVGAIFGAALTAQYLIAT
ncbi:hypothetical protein [Guyparkeria halopsychrophila]|uniref:hypothetical protein n=1 Tax=Guyparkeria halopsychrophila TaxID=3139421 RepID=UPI0037CC7058